MLHIQKHKQKHKQKQHQPPHPGQQTENAKINLVSPNPQEAVKMGDNQLVVEVLDPQTQKPVAVENLDVNVSMPMEGEEE